MAQILMVDNFDSFTYNLVDEFCCLDHQVTVIRNQVPLETAIELAEQSDLVVVSPGPGTPSESGICHPLLASLRGKIPFLGICLGHQLIIEQAGGTIARAEQPVHGKASLMTHDATHCFQGLDNPLRVGRYHSLLATDVPDDFLVLAQTNQEVMSVYHPGDRLLGFQFHPESILTTQGSRLLKQAVAELLSEPLNSDSQ